MERGFRVGYPQIQKRTVLSQGRMRRYNVTPGSRLPGQGWRSCGVRHWTGQELHLAPAIRFNGCTVQGKGPGLERCATGVQRLTPPKIDLEKKCIRVRMRREITSCTTQGWPHPERERRNYDARQSISTKKIRGATWPRRYGCRQKAEGPVHSGSAEGTTF